jgi:hypothetical protein
MVNVDGRLWWRNVWESNWLQWALVAGYGGAAPCVARGKTPTTLGLAVVTHSSSIGS